MIQAMERNLIHVHVSALDFLVTLGYFIIAQYLMRLATIYSSPDSSIGRALAWLSF